MGTKSLNESESERKEWEAYAYEYEHEHDKGMLVGYRASLFFTLPGGHAVANF